MSATSGTADVIGIIGDLNAGFTIVEPAHRPNRTHLECREVLTQLVPVQGLRLGRDA